MNEESASKIVRDVNEFGPIRVVINKNGNAVSAGRAKALAGIKAEITFVRNDGWTLGATRAMSKVAHDMWPEAWVGFIVNGEGGMRPMSEYES